MIIPDANLIIYAHNQADPDHAAALVWWKSLLAGDVDVGIPIVVVLAFLRLTTSPRILSKPLSVEESARRKRLPDWRTGKNAAFRAVLTRRSPLRLRPVAREPWCVPGPRAE